MELLVPADAEQAVINELSPHYTIGASIPETLPVAFFRVTVTGGTERDMVTDQPYLTLESFAKLGTTASHNLSDAIARLTRAAKLGSIGGVTAYQVRMIGLPQNFPLPSVPSHQRYVATLAPDLRRLSIPT